MQITADVSKILKTFKHDLTFSFNLLSKSFFGFLGCRKYCQFYKKSVFYRKRDSVTMRKYAETFQATHGYNMKKKKKKKNWHNKIGQQVDENNMNDFPQKSFFGEN